MGQTSLALDALPGLPEIVPGCDLAALLGEASARARLPLVDGDVLVVAQKAVSKAEGRYLDLSRVEPSPEALELARRVRKDPRFVEAVLRESSAVVRATATLTLLFQSLIKRSLVSGSCIICCVALPTECSCQMPITVIASPDFPPSVSISR